MVNVAFQCGACRRRTASEIHHHVLLPRSAEDFSLQQADLQIAATCSHCRQCSILTYTFYEDPKAPKHGRGVIADKIAQNIPETLVEEPVSQSPPLIARPPKGVFRHPEIWRAWLEAERVFVMQQWTLASIGYRRVLELGVKALESEPDRALRQPLGPRIARLASAGTISTEMHDLLVAAKAFGDEGAHGESALKDTDATIARELAEAFLRQAYTIPFLLEQARQHMSDKKPNR